MKPQAVPALPAPTAAVLPPTAAVPPPTNVPRPRCPRFFRDNGVWQYAEYQLAELPDTIVQKAQVGVARVKAMMLAMGWHATGWRVMGVAMVWRWAAMGSLPLLAMAAAASAGSGRRLHGPAPPRQPTAGAASHCRDARLPLLLLSPLPQEKDQEAKAEAEKRRKAAAAEASSA